MNKAHENINFVDYPLVDTPLASANLNKMDRSIDVIDDRVVAMDTSKANAEDVLLTIVDAQMSLTTGVITFTRKNGTTFTINTNLNRLATNLRYDSDPTSEHYQQLILTYNTDPVSYGYVDLTALITQYEFTDSSAIHFSVTNGNISATLIDGSITAEKLQPNFLADCNVAKAQAESAATGSNASALVAEGFSSGTQNGIPVTSESRYYRNNAEFFKNQASQIAAGNLAGLNDVTIDNPTQHQTILYDEQTQEWFNSDISSGLLPKLHIVTESNSSVTVTKGSDTFTPTLIEAGVYEMDAPEYGEYVVRAVNSIGTQTVNVVVDTCKIYNVTAYHFNATITVTYPAGATCTITKDGVSRTADTNPMAFGVNEVGTYTIAITEDGQTVSQNVTITEDGQTETLTLDFAYIALTIPSELIGQTVTITDGTSTRTWVSSATTHTFVCILGNYTLSIGGYSTSVNVVAYTTYTASIETWGYKGWLASAGIADTFGSLDALIADQPTIRTLMTKHVSCDYLYNWYTHDSSILSTVLSNTNTVKWFGLRDYVCDKFMANATAKTAILASANWEYILKDKVPVMTGASAPYGTAFASSSYSATFVAYKAFDKTNSAQTGDDCWASASGTASNQYVGYDFGKPILINACYWENRAYLATDVMPPKNYKIQGSNDNTTWEDITTQVNSDATSGATHFITFENNTYYRYLRFFVIDHIPTGATATYVSIGELQFYGRALNVSVPAMTSNTAPFGEVSASSTLGTNYDAWKAFNGTNASATDGWVSAQNQAVGAWIKYDFGKAVNLVKAYLQNRNENTPWSPHNYKIQGSNDGANYVDIGSGTAPNNNANTEYTCDITDSTPYRYVRLYVVDTESRAYVGLGKLNFYGVDYSEHTERHWIYDHGIEVETLATTGTVTKGADKLTLGASSSTAKVSIDTTDYDLLRGTTEDNASGTVALVCGGGSSTFTSANMPNNQSLDISSINGSNDTGVSMTANGTFDVAELWLE